MGVCMKQEKSTSICKIVIEEAEIQERMVSDVGGRPSRSSDDAMETWWSEGLGLFGSVINVQLQKVG